MAKKKKATREGRQDKYEELTHALNKDIMQDEARKH